MAIITLGKIIDEMSTLREKRRVLAEQDKLLKSRFDELSTELIAAFDSQDTRKGEGKKASASITETLVAQKVDWDMFMTWLVKTKNTQLVQQRISDPCFRHQFNRLGHAVSLLAIPLLWSRYYDWYLLYTCHGNARYLVYQHFRNNQHHH